jgi:DNA-binding response OmpR family regulator
LNKIIVIEDDIYLREELVNTFVKKGYSVSSISSFDAPEKEILNNNPDLAVLDINLPGKSGFELCKWLKARASFPILILTARDTLSDELYALGLGADDFLTKPCHPDRLIARAEFNHGSNAVEQCCFPGATGTHNSKEFAFKHVKTDSSEGFCLIVALTIDFCDTINL